MITTYEEFVSHGIESYTAERTVEAYRKRIGEVHGDYVITDIEYDFDNHGRLVTETCKGCGGKYQKFMVNGRNKWDELKKVCPVCEEERKRIVELGRKEKAYFDNLKRKEEAEELRNRKEIEKIFEAVEKEKHKQEKSVPVGSVYGRLSVLGWCYVNEQDRKNRIHYVCQCDCGNIVTVKPTNLHFGMTSSCGCLTNEYDKYSAVGKKVRLNKVWSKMKERCLNESHHAYKDYGGRGITVCDEWLDFRNFEKWALDNGYDINAPKGECTIDRIDVNGNYEPSNCRWVNMVTQANNTRRNHRVNIMGDIRSASDWDRTLNMGGRLKNLIYSGFDFIDVRSDSVALYSLKKGVEKILPLCLEN